MRAPRIDIAGQQFGRLTALEYVGGKQYKWLCRCACGTEREVSGDNLRKGQTQSCGCLSRERILDISGQVFGRWTALEYVGGKRSKWLCRCKCGTECEVDGSNLRGRITKSCGCLNREVVTTHGLTNHMLYNTWAHIKDRCYNPNSDSYHRYGGRGITVCAEWVNDFAQFVDDMGEKPHPNHTVERIDNNKGYNPENCRWDTRREQSYNRSDNNQVPGVHFVASSNKYSATIRVSGHKLSLGSYEQHSDAAYQRLSYEALADQGADADHLKLLRKFIKAVTGNKPVREPLYV